MIIKLAFDPLSTGALLAAGSAGKRLVGAAVSNQLHDIPHFISSKSNWLGKKVQKAALADSIIAAKRGSEGKVWANRKLLPSLFFGEQEGKAIVSHEANAVAGNIPKLKHLFKGNKLQVSRVKKVLGTARAIDRGALAGQIAAPTYLGYRDYKHEYEKSGNRAKAFRHGMVGAATGGLIAGGLEIPRRLAGKMSGLHAHLNKDNGYGYKLLEQASQSAEKSMNRPGILNYSKHFYTTPEKNAKGLTGKIVGDNLKRILGQKPAKGYDSVKGYIYPEDKKPGILSSVLNKVDETKNRITKMMTR
jgi:hypothetical protein